MHMYLFLCLMSIRYNNNIFLRTPFFKMMVPTVDTVRYGFITSVLVRNNFPVLLVGPVGTGKTSVAYDVCDKMDSKQFNVLTVNMSAQVKK